jgi:hypothetical protein
VCWGRNVGEKRLQRFHAQRERVVSEKLVVRPSGAYGAHVCYTSNISDVGGRGAQMTAARHHVIDEDDAAIRWHMSVVGYFDLRIGWLGTRRGQSEPGSAARFLWPSVHHHFGALDGDESFRDHGV